MSIILTYSDELLLLLVLDGVPNHPRVAEGEGGYHAPGEGGRDGGGGGGGHRGAPAQGSQAQGDYDVGIREWFYHDTLGPTGIRFLVLLSLNLCFYF